MKAEKTSKARRVLLGAAAIALAVAGLSSRASAVNQYFFDWDNVNVGSGTNYAAAPPISDNPSDISAAQAALSASQAQGKPLAVRVVSTLSPTGPGIQIFNQYPIQYVFADYEGAARTTQTSALVTQVQGSSQSKNAFVGNFGTYPGMQADPTRSSSVSDEYTAGRSNMANPDLYPGSPDYRNPASGNSTAPNIRSALFTLPIERLTIAANGLYGRGTSLSQTNNGSATDTSFAGGFKSGPLIPYATRFNNYGNAALSNAGVLPDGERPFVQTAANPASGQLPSRGDFMAQILQYRMRGADSINLFQASVIDRFGNAYTDTQQQLDLNQGWFVTGQPGSVGNSVNGIFATHHYGFANLSNLVSLDTNRPGGAPLRSNFEALGVAYSGVYTEGAGTTSPTVGQAAFRDRFGVFHPAVPASQLALIISNLSNTTQTIDLGTVAGNRIFTPNDPNGTGQDDVTVAAGEHRLVTFSLRNQAGLGLGTIAQQNAGGKPVWLLTENQAVFGINDRDGTGTPEPASFAIFGLGALGLLARRRKAAAQA